MATFGPERRIRKRSDYQRIQGGKAQTARVNAPHFLFLVSRRANLDLASAPSRIGIVASKKVGNAVARNRVKRLVRAAFRLLPELFPHGIDVVVVPRPGTDALALADVLNEWRGVAKVIAGKSRNLAVDTLAAAAGKTQAPRAPVDPTGAPAARRS